VCVSKVYNVKVVLFSVLLTLSFHIFPHEVFCFRFSFHILECSQILTVQQFEPVQDMNTWSQQIIDLVNSTDIILNHFLYEMQ
jgi:hypothetical protein